jgi:hypothetical protein
MGNKAVEKVDPVEEAKKQKKVVDRAVRTIEREIKKMEKDEATILKTIKTMAVKN